MYLFEIVKDDSEFAATEHIMYLTDENKFNEEGHLNDEFPEAFYDLMAGLADHGIYELAECEYEVDCNKEDAETAILATGQFTKSEAFTKYIEDFEK